jgi:glucose-1-phosphate adenylyltransferase
MLAGGAGERLNPLTEAKPKPAVSFGGTHRIIDFTLSNCINSGLRKVFVLTQYQREHLHDYIRETRARMSQFFRWHEGDQLLPVPPVGGKRYRGTANAVFQNLPLIRFDAAEDVLIVSGDHIYSMDYRPLLWRHTMSGADMTVAVVQRPVHEASRFGVADIEDGMVTGLREKPHAESLPPTGEVPVSMGVYVFKRRTLIDIADTSGSTETDFANNIIPRLIRQHRVAAYDFGSASQSYWRDVGTLDTYFQANMDLLGAKPQFQLETNLNWPMYTCGDSATANTGGSRVSRGASVRSRRVMRSVVSHGASIEAGAIVENSVVLPGARIGADVHLRNVIVAEGVTIPDGFEIGLDPDKDAARFKVTSEGVVIVDGQLGLFSERTVCGRSHHAVGVA